MKIIFERRKTEAEVDIDFSYFGGTLTINFSPDFEGNELELIDGEKVVIIVAD